MAIRIKTRIESYTLVLPELRPLVGKAVEISVTESSETGIDRLLDSDYHADCESDTSPEVPLADVRAALSSITGDPTAERDERQECQFNSSTQAPSASIITRKQHCISESGGNVELKRRSSSR